MRRMPFVHRPIARACHAVTTFAVPTGWRPTIVGNNFYTLSNDEQDVPCVVRARIRDQALGAE